MFDSLAEKIKADDRVEINTTERVVRWFAVIVLAVLIFGGLYYSVRLLE